MSHDKALLLSVGQSPGSRFPCLAGTAGANNLPIFAEPDSGFSGAIPSAAPKQRESLATAGVHIPPSGICHKHRLLQPLDRTPLVLAGPSHLGYAAQVAFHVADT